MMERCHAVIYLMLPAALWASSARLLAQNMELPEQISAALAAAGRQLNPIDVSYTHTTSTLLSPEDLVKKLKAPFPSLFSRVEPVRMVWQDAKFYQRSVASSSMGDLATESSFDGAVLYGGGVVNKTNGRNVLALWRRSMSKLANDSPDETFVSSEYFDAAGLLLPARARDLVARKPAQSSVLSLLEGTGQVTAIEDAIIDGHRLTRVQISADNVERRAAERRDLATLERNFDNPLAGSTPQDRQELLEYIDRVKKGRTLPEKRLYEFYLDPQMNYAVCMSEERYDDGTLLKRVRNEQFEQLPGRQVWLARKSTIDRYTYELVPGTFFTTPICSEVIAVQQFSVEPVPDAQFVLNYTAPGTTVYDDMAGITYMVPAGGADLDRAAGDVAALLAGQGGPSSQVSRVVLPSTLPSDSKASNTEPPLAGSVVPSRADHGISWRMVILLNMVAFLVLGAALVWRCIRGSRNNA